METGVSLKELLWLLQKIPVITPWNPWLELRIADQVKVFKSIADFKVAINRLELLADTPTVVFCSENEWKYLKHSFLPLMRCTYDPFGDPEFERVLAARFDYLCHWQDILVQSKVADYFVRAVDTWQPMLAVLMIIDGLSYIDFRENEVNPCLVDGVSLTPESMRRIVGMPHISERLFERGFTNRIGFSYWERDNELTDYLFFGFTSGQLVKVECFEDALDRLGAEQQRHKTYVQIVRTGLDGYIHSHRDRPPKEYLVEAIRRDIKNLVDGLRRTRRRFILFVTADHGILWASDFPKESVFLNEGRVPVRYYRQEERIPE